MKFLMNMFERGFLFSKPIVSTLVFLKRLCYKIKICESERISRLTSDHTNIIESEPYVILAIYIINVNEEN